MILFAPSYDEATAANHAVAVRLGTGDGMSLLGRHATGNALYEVLSTSAAPVLALSHGTADVLRGDQGTIALDMERLALAAPRSIFAFACDTSRRLGRRAGEAGWIWWGYIAPITSPDDRAETLPVFVELFAFVRDHFPRCTAQEEVHALLLHIKDRCEHAGDKLYEILQARDDLDLLGAFKCVDDFWNLLAVWRAGAIAPERHPASRAPLEL